MKKQMFILLFAAVIVAICLQSVAVLAEDEFVFTLAPRIAEKVKNGEKLVIYASYHDVSNEFAPQIKAGVEKAGEDLNVTTKLVGPVGADADAQIAELESLIDAEVIDGIAISSVSTDALAPVINRALEAGVPVVAFNTDNPNSHRLAFVGQDLINSGRIVADLLVKHMGEKGKVIIVTLDASAQWSIDRESGVREVLEKYKDINVLSTINCGTEPQQYYANIENALLTYPDLNGIVSLECCTNPAAGEIVKRENLSDQITVVGFDLLDTTLALVKSGDVKATIDQDPYKQGYEAIKTVYEALQGKEVKDVDTGALVVDSTNIDEFLK